MKSITARLKNLRPVTVVALIGLVVLLGLAGLAARAFLISNSPEATAQRAEQCANFAAQEPGSLEGDWSRSVLDDPDASEQDKILARSTVSWYAQFGSWQRHVYDCEKAEDYSRFQWYVENRLED